MSSFIQFARAHGLEIDPARLYPSEKIKRCGTTEKPRSSNGAYFWDGQRGWVFNWSDQAQVQWFNDPSAQPWTQAEKDTWRAKRQAKRAMQRAMALAPRTLRDEITRMAESTGLLPKPDGYTEDGQPVVSLEAVAAQLGITLEEAQAHMDAMLAELEAAGVSMPAIDPARVHRVQ